MQDKKLVQQLNRISGQVDGIKRMVIEHRYTECTQVIQQVKAVSGALKKFTEEFVKSELSKCISDKKSIDEVQTELQKIISTTFAL